MHRYFADGDIGHWNTESKHVTWRYKIRANNSSSFVLLVGRQSTPSYPHPEFVACSRSESPHRLLCSSLSPAYLILPQRHTWVKCKWALGRYINSSHWLFKRCGTTTYLLFAYKQVTRIVVVSFSVTQNTFFDQLWSLWPAYVTSWSSITYLPLLFNKLGDS